MSEIQHVHEKVCEAERVCVRVPCIARIQMCKAAKLKENARYRSRVWLSFCVFVCVCVCVCVCVHACLCVFVHACASVCASSL